MNVALLLGSLAFSLLLGEATFRWIARDDSPVSMDIYRLDADGDLALNPNIMRRHLTREWNVVVATNGEGLRDRLTPLSDTHGRILALGDSYTFGWGVEFPKTFLYRAEEALRVRVIKAGVPGTGTTDQLQWLRHHAEAVAPQLVIVSLYIGNDFVDVAMGGAEKQFIIRDGLMIKRSVEGTERTSLVGKATQTLKRKSRLAQKLAGVLWYFQNTFTAPQDRSNPGLNARDRWLWEFAKVHLRQPPPETVRAFDLTRAALDDIDQWCRQHNARLLLLVLPRSIQIYDWELAKWKEAFGLSDDALDLDQPQRVLSEWAAAKQVALLDLLPEFRAYATSHPNDRLYFYPDGHMNVAGNQLAGTLLIKSLKGLGY